MSLEWRAAAGVLEVRAPSSGNDITDNVLSAVAAAKGTAKPYRVVKLPPGRWQLSDTIDIGDDSINGSCVLTGDRPAFGMTTAEAYTHLECQFDDRPAVTCQGGRAPVIANIFFDGQNHFGSQISDVQDILTDANFLLPGVTTACSAIELDPVAGIAGSAPRIIDCSFRGFYAGIRAGTSGDAGTLNLENGRAVHCTFDHVAKPFLFGQHQTKGWALIDCTAFRGHYFLDCVSEGLGLGYPPEIRGGFAHQFQRLFNIPPAIGRGLVATGFYAENCHAIGTLGHGPTSVSVPCSLNHCEFLFADQGDAAIDAHLLASTQVAFRSCYFNHNSGTEKRVFRVLSLQDIIFDGCVWGSPASLVTDVPLIDKSQSSSPDIPLDTNFRMCRFRDAAGSKKLRGDIGADELALGSAAVTAGVVTGEAEFTITDVGLADVVVGDLVRPANPWVPKIHVPGQVAPGSWLALGVVKDITGDTVTLAHVPETILAALPLPSQTLTRRRITAA